MPRGGAGGTNPEREKFTVSSGSKAQDLAVLDRVVSDDVIATVIEAAQQANARKKEPSPEEKMREAARQILGALGGLSVQEDALIFEGTRIILPEQYEGKVEQAIDFLVNHIKQEKQTFKFHRTFKARPFDGAHGFMTVMKQITGTTGHGKTKMTMFGPVHPQFVSVNVSPTDHEQVPWGEVNFPMYEATFTVTSTHDDDFGSLFHLVVEAPRKYRKEIEGIFNYLEHYLSENSIYRGKAIYGGENPEFVDVDQVDPDAIVYNADTFAQLDAHVWVPIKHTDTVRNLGISVNRKVLFGGPFGTGKTLGCMLTAKIAAANAWTTVICRTGKDDPSQVMQTAALYGPAVVVIEDLDVHAEGGTKADISRMLEMLDGVTSKGREIVCLFTTNHVEDIQRGAMRPGRIDAVIQIGMLDVEAFKKLVTLSVGDFLDKKVDWEAVATAFDGFLPAFVKEAAVRSQRYTMARNNGVPGKIGTDDLVYAADSLRPQLDLMVGANEGATKVRIDDLVRETVEETLSRAIVAPNDRDDEVMVKPYKPLAAK